LESLRLALEYNVKTIAFPNISTGIYNFPKDKAAAIAIDTITHFEETASIDKVLFVCYDEENYALYKKLLKQ